MRMLTLPAAVLIACLLYPIFPRTADLVDRGLAFLYAQTLRLFTRRSGSTDQKPALAVFLLLLCAAATLPGALHPAAAAVMMAPLFTGLSVMPACADAKRTLDSGQYARNIPAYEAHVRSVCASVSPAFVRGLAAPMLLCAAGMPLHLGPALGWLLHALRLHADTHPLAARITGRIDRIADAVFCALMTLCSGVTGRNPFRTQGKDSLSRMMNILGIAGDGTDTHAPVSGDISQAAFLCCFAASLLLLMLTLVGFALC